jgi:hypothetical protein
MTSLIVDYLAKSIIFFFFVIYYILNMIVPVNPREENESTFLEDLSTYILDE